MLVHALAATLLLMLVAAQADPSDRPLSLRGIPPCRSCAGLEPPLSPGDRAGLGLGLGLGLGPGLGLGLGHQTAAGLAAGAWAFNFVPSPGLPAAGEEADASGLFPDGAGLLSRLSRQGRSGGVSAPFWPLRHPALDTRKRHRDAPGFLHPVVRFVQPLSLGELGGSLGGPLGGPYAGGDDGWGEEPARPLLDNLIRDTDKARPLTAEELIRALQGKQRPSEEAGAKASALRFGGMIGRKK